MVALTDDEIIALRLANEAKKKRDAGQLAPEPKEAGKGKTKGGAGEGGSGEKEKEAGEGDA